MGAYQDDDRWRYRFTLNGKRYSGSTPKGGNTKRLAERLERDHIEKIQARLYTGEMPTVAAFIDRFLEHQAGRTKPTTQRAQRSHLKLHVAPHIGKRPLDSVELVDVDGMVTTWRTGGAAVRTCNARLATLKRMFSQAIEWRFIAAAPKAKPLPRPKDTPRFLTDDESEALLAAMTERWRSMCLVALRTGLRIGELRALWWGDVDIERMTIRVRRTDPGRSGLPAGTPKSGADRSVPLTAESAGALAALRTAAVHSGPHSFVWPGFISRTRSTPDRSRSENSCVVAIRTAAAKAGIQGDGDRAIGWHTLRHTYASQLVMRGTRLQVVQELLGHADITMTMRYAHLAPNASHHAEVASLDYKITPSQPATKALPSGDGSDPE